MQRDTRERVLQAAEEAFALNGYAGARIRDIAGKAGVTNAMVHYYFRTKEDLLRAVLDRMVDEVVELAAGIAPEPIDPVEKLKLFFYGFFDFASRHPHFARIGNLEAGHEDDAFFRSQVQEKLLPLYLKARGFLEGGARAGVFRPIPPEHLLTAIYGMIVSYFSDVPFLQALLGEGVMEESMLASRREELMDMILRIVMVEPE